MPLASLPAAEADLARVRLARALLARGRAHEGRALLAAGPGRLRPTPPRPPSCSRATRRAAAARPTPYELVADHFRGTPWAEEALLSLANHYQKDALDDAALPWWRRLLTEYPDGRYVERAAWRAAGPTTGPAATKPRPQPFESAGAAAPAEQLTRRASCTGPAARAWPWARPSGPGALLEETVQRYKHAYHGLRAREALARLGGRPAPRGSPSSPTARPRSRPCPSPAPRACASCCSSSASTRRRGELRLLPESPRVQATIAWIDWRRGRYRPAITAMKRAYPEWVGEAGDRLPREVWRILFPLRYESELRAAAQEEALDPALVAALILQESTFDAAAPSAAPGRAA